MSLLFVCGMLFFLLLNNLLKLLISEALYLRGSWLSGTRGQQALVLLGAHASLTLCRLSLFHACISNAAIFSFIITNKTNSK